MWVTTPWPLTGDLVPAGDWRDHGVPIIRQACLPFADDVSDDLLEQCWTYLHIEEQATCQGLHGRRRAEWLLGRVALKESVRAWQAASGHPVLAAQQMPIRVDDHGAPWIVAPGSVSPEVSLAHTRTGQGFDGSVVAGVVMAMASAPGARVGIDVEHAQRRLPTLDRILNEYEQTLAAHEFGALGLVVAKEAAAKAAGSGLQGSLGRWPVVGRRGSCVYVADDRGQVRPVRLTIDGSWIVGVCADIGSDIGSGISSWALGAQGSPSDVLN